MKMKNWKSIVIALLGAVMFCLTVTMLSQDALDKTEASESNASPWTEEQLLDSFKKMVHTKSDEDNSEKYGYLVGYLTHKYKEEMAKAHDSYLDFCNRKDNNSLLQYLHGTKDFLNNKGIDPSQSYQRFHTYEVDAPTTTFSQQTDLAQNTASESNVSNEERFLHDSFLKNPKTSEKDIDKYRDYGYAIGFLTMKYSDMKEAHLAFFDYAQRIYLSPPPKKNVFTLLLYYVVGVEDALSHSRYAEDCYDR